MEFKIGIAVIANEYQLMTNGVEYFHIYPIPDWEGLGSIKQGTKTLVISKEWLLAEGLPVIENILLLSDYYRGLGITVYYYSPDFDSLDKVDIEELSDLLNASFCNILIGQTYHAKELELLMGYEMTPEDWREWLGWIEGNRVAQKSNEKNVFLEKARVISFKEIIDWTSLKESTQQKIANLNDKRNEIELPQLPVRELAKTSSEALQVFVRDYLKGTVCIIAGVTVMVVGVKPLVEMNISNKNAMSEWEELKSQQTTAVLPTETPELEESKPTDLQSHSENHGQGLIGIIKLPHKENAIGVRLGTSDAILNKGAGLDESTVTSLGKRGNAVIYGHREEVFWELKSIQKGDEIIVETLEETLIYRVFSTRVTYPEDETIYKNTKDHKITLVTCHPFVYMGATPERFVVEAELVRREEG